MTSDDLIEVIDEKTVDHREAIAKRPVVPAEVSMALAAAKEPKVVEALARAELRTSEAAMAGTLAKAASLDAFLIGFDWQSLEALERLQDQRRATAEAIRMHVADALRTDEYATPLKPALEQAREKALRLLAEASTPVSVRAQPAPLLPLDGLDGAEEVEIAAETHANLPAKDALALLETLERRLQAEPDGHLSIQWRLTRRPRGT
ncbi:MAG: DUF2336 domain-containing protein [Rhodospirillales bacterium]|nr:DUF2336 domain-containing protein [Rhodospirillales bacterium]